MKKTIAMMFFWSFLNDTAFAQTLYYQGKTVTIIVGTGAGDLYDLYARAIALFMGKYLPGNPGIIVQNMPGAGHMIAANYIYTVAKPDGLTLGAINAGLYFEQLVGRAEVKFDWPNIPRSVTRPNHLKFSICARIAHSKPSTPCAVPKSRRNAAPRARETWATSCRNFWKKRSEQNSM